MFMTQLKIVLIPIFIFWHMGYLIVYCLVSKYFRKFQLPYLFVTVFYLDFTWYLLPIAEIWFVVQQINSRKCPNLLEIYVHPVVIDNVLYINFFPLKSSIILFLNSVSSLTKGSLLKYPNTVWLGICFFLLLCIYFPMTENFICKSSIFCPMIVLWIISFII